jgi:ABC-type polysaccharide/polyol phosphate export permease
MAMDVIKYMPYFSLGFITWTFISTTLNEACLSFQESERIIKQIKLPFTAYVLRVVWRNFIVLLHTIAIFIPIAILCSVPIGWVSLLSLPGLALICVNVTWLTLALAIIGTRYRDFIQMVQTGIQIMMFATPILWTVHSLRGSTLIADVNPLYHLVEVMRAPLMGDAPAALSWFVVIGIAIAGWTFTTLLLARTVRRIVFWL